MFKHINELGKAHESAADQIFRIIKDEFGYSKEQVISKCRDQEIIFFRMIFSVILKKHTNCSLAKIGEYLGGRDHTTILNAIRRHEGKCDIIPNSFPKKYNDENYVSIFHTIYYRYIKENNTEECLIEKKKIIYKKISILQEELSDINNELQVIKTTKSKLGKSKTSWLG